MDGFPEYKALQKQIDEIDRRVVTQAIELSRLRTISQTTRDDVTRLTTALLGNENLGMRGLLDRLEHLEERLTRVWWVFLVSLGIGALLNVITIYYLLRLVERG